jgi:hypothetical protein
MKSRLTFEYEGWTASRTAEGALVMTATARHLGWRWAFTLL